MAKRQKKSLLSTVTEDKVESKEEILKELQEEKKATKRVKQKPVRVSVDFPKDLYRVMKDDVEDRAETLRTFIVSLVRNHYTNKGKI